MPDTTHNGMQCHEFDQLLIDAIDGILSGAALDRFQAHARVCKVCGPLLAEAEAGRNWLKGRTGDRCNALLAAAGFNLRQLLRFLRGITYFLRNFFCAILAALRPTTTLAVYTGFQYDFLTAD